MDEVCSLKAKNCLVQSTMEAAISGFTSFAAATSPFEKPNLGIKKMSPERFRDFTEHETPRKQKRTDCLDVARTEDDVKVHVADINTETPDKTILEANDCHRNSLTESKITDVTRKGEELYFDTAQNLETMKLNHIIQPKRSKETFPVFGFKIGRGGYMKSRSVSSLGSWSDCTSYASETNQCTTTLLATADSDQEETRCRSLPCQMIHESHTQDSLPYFASRLSPNLSSQHCQVSSFNNNIEVCCSPPQNTEAVDTNSEYKNEQESCYSGSATPSPYFIDVEDNTSPCSPLNLTTNDNEFNISKSQNTDDRPNNAENSVEDSNAVTTQQLEMIPHFHKRDNSLLHKSSDDLSLATEAKEFVEKCPANEMPQEKKTNFSIDAILRPDFGAIRVSSQISNSFHRLNVQANNPRIRGAIRSTNSAFTAVDLSTRSRSDSLSSPSCSSSSPSPPLSVSSPSPRLKPEFNHVSMYDKHPREQEHFLFSSRLFPEPNKELENIINGRIPFIGPPHSNGLGYFPFMYTPQDGLQNKYVYDRDSSRHKEFNSQDSRTKTDHLKSDISKLLSRSLYPFVANSQNSRTDILKLSRNHGNQIKTGSETDLLDVVNNKQKKNSVDLSSVTKSSAKIQDESFQSKTGSRGQANLLDSGKDTSTNCKIELKHEKSGQKEKKSGDSSAKATGGNSLWPAWVFCTRYSDRPSSGPRSRKPKRSKTQDEKRPRTAFTNEQLVRLKREFEDCRYLTEARRKSLADELGLTESQIKIWFQNKRAKIKKSVGVRNPLAMKLMEQGLYNHSTVKLSDDSS